MTGPARLICFMHTLATAFLAAATNGSSADETRRLTPRRDTRGPGCEASPTRSPLRPFLAEHHDVRSCVNKGLTDPLLGLHATGIRRLKCPNESSRRASPPVAVWKGDQSPSRGSQHERGHSTLQSRILAVHDLQCAWLLLLCCAAARANSLRRNPNRDSARVLCVEMP